MTLSKSDYLLFLKHPAWLWLKKFDKSKLPPIDDNQQAIFDSGHLFEEYAEQLFPDSEKLSFGNYEEYISLPLRTKNAVDKGIKTILQGRFEYGSLTCIVDVLDKTGENKYDLYEIKSSASAKPEHTYDLAFQVFVLEKLGLRIERAFVIHVNTQYRRSGEVKTEEITSIVDVTPDVKAAMQETKENIERAQKVADSKTPPSFSPRYSGNLKEWLEIFRFINPDLERYSIYSLTGISQNQIAQLEDLGISSISDIPQDFSLTPKQKQQVESVKSGKQFIDKNNIKLFLDKLKYPLYFLDYETLSSVIPYFDGLSPYQQLPFQYSIHVMEKPGGELLHREYLHTISTHPGLPILESLKRDIGIEGSVIVWNESFEKGRNKELGELFPEYDDFVTKLNERVVDLMIPFSKGWYVDKDFFGSASIKKVLPALVSDLSYDDLDIHEGGSAQRSWMETILDGKNPEQKEKIMNDLIEYCELDTLAMVRLYQVLKESVEGLSEVKTT